jgi:DNA-binding MarR family transcriptional regulator
MSKAKSSKLGPLDKSPSHLLHRALQRALDLYGHTAGPDAVSQRQYAVLAAVAADEGLTQSQLVRSTGIDRSTLAELVARMISKGLLARERSTADARAKAVRLTDRGREAMEEAAPRAAEADAALMKLLPSGKRSPFLSALGRIASPKADKPEKAPKAKKAAKREKGEKNEKKARKKAKKDRPPVAEPVAA